MKRVSIALFLLFLLAGCEGKQGPMGPAGPQGDPGLDGGGVVSVHAWQNESPLDSSAYEVAIPGWAGLQAGQSVNVEAFVAADIDGTIGWVELPMLVIGDDGLGLQAAAVIDYDDGTITFTNLQGWYAYFLVTVFRAENVYP